jgi:hypothetical protein
MNFFIVLIPILTIASACSRPETPPPTTPIKPPTVETMPTPTEHTKP